MELSLKKNQVVGATLLVTGCCIGAGMIGLPVISLTAGFIPSFVAMVFSYLFTTATGLLLLEATLWFREKVNLLSLAEETLGKAAKWILGALFLFLFYAIFIAYMDGGGRIFNHFLESVFQSPLPREVGIFSCVAFVTLILSLGMRAVDKVNQLFLVGLALAYGCLVLIGLPHIEPQNLAHQNWKASLATLPILFICFGYQNLVPSLVPYLKRDAKALQIAILIGNLIPLLFYSLWNYVILGLLPPTTASESPLVTDLLMQASSSSWILFSSHLFSFFALITSFIAISVSFVDFFKDGLPEGLFKNKKLYEISILTLVFFPPLLFCLFYPSVFLQALDFAGGIIDVLLFGLFPPLIVWAGRYLKKWEGSYQVPGGKVFLILLLGLSLTLLVLRQLSL